MIQVRHWHDFPSKRVRAALPRFTWEAVGDASPGASTAALMVYIALRFTAHNYENGDEDIYPKWVSAATYEDLCEIVGISKTMVFQGLQRLKAEELIEIGGSSQKRRYQLIWDDLGWFKLPCQALLMSNNRLLVGNKIRPFQSFSLRSKYELHALKMYLYIAAVRPNGALHTEVSYEKIHERLGIAEKDVRKAISHLINCGLLDSADRERSTSSGQYGPNQYYMAGHMNILRDSVIAQKIANDTRERRALQNQEDQKRSQIATG